ncbi:MULTISPECIES: hypothetical protein [unclassified Kitasatospora]
MIELRELTPDDATALQRIYSPESTGFEVWRRRLTLDIRVFDRH